jgi:hypothetical protein
MREVVTSSMWISQPRHANRIFQIDVPHVTMDELPKFHFIRNIDNTPMPIIRVHTIIRRQLHNNVCKCMSKYELNTILLPYWYIGILVSSYVVIVCTLCKLDVPFGAVQQLNPQWIGIGTKCSMHSLVLFECLNSLNVEVEYLHQMCPLHMPLGNVAHAHPPLILTSNISKNVGIMRHLQIHGLRYTPHYIWSSSPRSIFGVDP